MDLAAAYTLNPPNLADLVLNANSLRPGDGQTGYYVTRISGLTGQAPIRAPNDPAAQTDGAILHARKKGGRLPLFEGIYLVPNTLNEDAVATLWNQMEAALQAVLDDCGSPAAPGTLSWVERGIGARSIQFLSQVPLDSVWAEGHMTWSFGLATAAAEPS
jgi:hypothetical protein